MWDLVKIKLNGAVDLDHTVPRISPSICGCKEFLSAQTQEILHSNKQIIASSCLFEQNNTHSMNILPGNRRPSLWSHLHIYKHLKQDSIKLSQSGIVTALTNTADMAWVLTESLIWLTGSGRLANTLHHGGVGQAHLTRIPWTWVRKSKIIQMQF